MLVRSARLLVVLGLGLGLAPAGTAQEWSPTPLRQSSAEAPSDDLALTLRDAARNDRWLGRAMDITQVRWAPDGSGVYFRWNPAPRSDDVPAEDPWFFADASGERVRHAAPDEHVRIPEAEVAWGPSGRRAAWSREGTLVFFDGSETRSIVRMEGPVRNPRFAQGEDAIDFESGEALFRYGIADGSVRALARRVNRASQTTTEAGEWLADQQREIFEYVRTQDDVRQRAAAAGRSTDAPQAIPVAANVRVDQIRVSPDGYWITFRARTPASNRPSTAYIDYVDDSGYSEVGTARAKVGEPRDVVRLGVVRVDPSVPVGDVEVRWIDVTESGDQNTVPHGPYWSSDGLRAVAQFIGEDHEDLWYAELYLESATATVLTHDHDEAWIGGPPVQANYLQPAWMEWLPDGSLLFASERTGWSHLYRLESSGRITPLTEGEWEVRGARLSRDRTRLLVQASREHPAEDHLYTMPATGGEMRRLTTEPGRHEGRWSPDGRRLAVVFGSNADLPDLGLRSSEPDGESRAVTVSGTDAFFAHPLAEPEIVSFPHPDGDPVWAALYRPERPNAERAAIVHIHGGGYRQFAHRGYSVYGWGTHLGFIHYMLEQGYTVLDFDYRGSAGFGRDYRTDISESMGIKDTDGAAAAARWLADAQGVHPDRIGIYGVSYGGFLTLTSLFRYPGVFAAGVARASVTDWAHYSDGWTSRILGVPHENPEAYRRSSPIYYAEGLEDALLITHGLVDDNVHFQDSARLIQRLIELEKDFEVMVYPVEPHTIQTESGRYDLLRRQARFFDEELRGIRPD